MIENELIKIKDNEIKSLIYEIRNKQVMLDNDVARLYGYETKVINQNVKRNIKRFPEEFYFQLSKYEYDEMILKSQNVTSSYENKIIHGGKRKLPFVFTEQGIAMLSGLLKNEIAIEVSIQIMQAFVNMRRFINTNSNLFERMVNIENKIDIKFLEYNNKFDKVFDALQREKEFNQKIFFNGQIYDAYSLIVDIIKKAKKVIIIIDNYIDKTI